MNFLPFVFTFLLILSFISSFLFSSLRGTARENKVILVQHKTYLHLISEQNKKLFKKYQKSQPQDAEKNLKPHPPKDKKTQKKRQEPRLSHEGYEKSKLNLIPLIHGDVSALKPLLERTAIRLIEILYGGCAFYTSSSVKDIARTIVKHMMEEKIESLEELTFKNNKPLEQVYYKMLKGTNTGYPSLSEYICFNKKEKTTPIFFYYASKPVLRAALGEEFAKKVFDLEMKNWLEDSKCKALNRSQFTALLTSSKLDSQIESLMNFNRRNKGLRQIGQAEKEKIRALRHIDDT